MIYLAAMLVHTAVYAQYLSTLPLDVHASGVPTLWYTTAISLNGFIVIAFELPLTKITQRWPFTVTVGLGCALEGLGVACYGLPIGLAVILGGTLIWTLGEVIGGPAIFAYPAVVAPRQHKSGYIGSCQFVFASGTAAGPAIGGLLFSQLGHHVWPVLAIGSLIATVFVLTAVRNTPKSAAPADNEDVAMAPTENIAIAAGENLTN